MAQKLKRNDECHCGSGKKYKNCCLQKDEANWSSKLGVLGLALVILLGIYLFATNFSAGGGGQNCPAGQTWSQSHQHCH
jgi:hypothetical protein